VSSAQTRAAIKSEFARLLKEVREERGLSLGALAQRAGLNRQTITFIEQQVRTPNLDTMLRISSALGLRLGKLIADAEKRAGR
jgi:transcriptional regulator with XRE-family HTH domain